MRPLALVITALLAALACGEASVHRFEVTGLVEDVDHENAQLMIAHEEIPGFMAAMTMNFAVHEKDSEILSRVRSGHKIDFVLEASQDGYYITEATVVGEADVSDGWARLGEVLVRTDPAPLFALGDQNGEAFALAAQTGKAVLLDFIFTRCQGPCPILTAKHVVAQRELPPEVRERVHFVSISLDPEYDTPQQLTRYAQKHGVDASHWSLLTGTAAEVNAIASHYGIGSTRMPDGDIEHVVATFLIEVGDGTDARIVKRYLGLQTPSAEIVADLQALAAKS